MNLDIQCPATYASYIPFAGADPERFERGRGGNKEHLAPIGMEQFMF